ncbi:MAG: YfcE family phosphodiesterase [Clostridia bacterium]|nr:YfcE family phosphodiesterase [Clostridia bacterium]
MDILVFSDSHGRTSKLLEAFERQVKRPDAIVFLGDGLRDVAYCDFGDIPLYAVCGNCDFYSVYGGVRGEDEILITLGGKRIMMTHGHDYGVKSSLGRLVASAVRKDADIVLFGHTHMPLEKHLPAGESEFGITLEKPLDLFNPGSIGGYDSDFGCVTINGQGRVMLSHGTLCEKK